MPINYDNYPPDWKERRERILARAENCCEWCGVKNKAVGARDMYGDWHDSDSIRAMGRDLGFSRFGVETVKEIQIVLTVAHLDHDETNWNVKDERLAALCQRCHIQYDAPEKARRRRAKRYQKTLFTI